MTEVPAMYRLVPVALLTALLCTTFVSADWPVFRGNPHMTGADTAARPVAFPDQLEEKWTFSAGSAKTGGIEGAPAIVGGVVYVASLDKHLYAIDLATGKQKWKVKLGPMKASPSVKGDRVYEIGRASCRERV